MRGSCGGGGEGGGSDVVLQLGEGNRGICADGTDHSACARGSPG